ncbi:MAG TPA: hypothetical protein DD379_26515, partial [Cyanobacteria bacterium UBA11162]|nr:hypothetical protein [Cyanobacteria bacterium UBA11162]
MVHLPAQSDPPLSPRQTLPTMYDLPSENLEEPGLPDEFHGLQPLLLRQTFKPTNYNPEEIFIGADINLYYDLHHPNWYKRPDWFAVVGVSQLYEGRDLRLSYVLWQELVSPFVVVELLSPGTEEEDLGQTIQKIGSPPTKWHVYEQILRVPYYIVFSRYTNEIQIFRLVGGAYEPVQLTDGRLLIPQLGLSLGLWQGSYETIERLWLRWFTLSGELILTPDEEAATANHRAILAEERAILAEERAI